MKFTQIPTDTFSQLQLNAGLLLKSFTPSTGTLDKADIVILEVNENLPWVYGGLDECTRTSARTSTTAPPTWPSSSASTASR